MNAHYAGDVAPSSIVRRSSNTNMGRETRRHRDTSRERERFGPVTMATDLKTTPDILCQYFAANRRTDVAMFDDVMGIRCALTPSPANGP